MLERLEEEMPAHRDVEAMGARGLEAACKSGQVDVVRALLAEGVNVDGLWCREDRAQASPLLLACFHGHVRVVLLLLSAGLT